MEKNSEKVMESYNNNSGRCLDENGNSIDMFLNCYKYGYPPPNYTGNSNMGTAFNSMTRRNKGPQFNYKVTPQGSMSYFDVNDPSSCYNSFYPTDPADYYWFHIPVPYWPKNILQADPKNKFNQYNPMGWLKTPDATFQPPCFQSFPKNVKNGSKYPIGSKLSKKERSTVLRASYKNDETDDNILYKGYGHLLRFNKETFSWEWINRGHLKILQKENDHRCIRLLMYSKTSRAPVLNQSLYSQSEFRFDEIERFTVSWMHKFFANERLEQNKYGLRFRNYNRSEKFLLAVRSVKTQMLSPVDGKLICTEELLASRGPQKLEDILEKELNNFNNIDKYLKRGVYEPTNEQGNETLNSDDEEASNDKDSEASGSRRNNDANGELCLTPSFMPFRYTDSKGLFFNQNLSDANSMDVDISPEVNVINAETQSNFCNNFSQTSNSSFKSQETTSQMNSQFENSGFKNKSEPNISWINTGFKEFIPEAKYHKTCSFEDGGLQKAIDIIYSNPKNLFENSEDGYKKRLILNESLERDLMARYNLEKQMRSEKAKNDVIEKLSVRDEMCKDPNIFLVKKPKKPGYPNSRSYCNLISNYKQSSYKKGNQDMSQGSNKSLSAAQGNRSSSGLATEVFSGTSSGDKLFKANEMKGSDVEDLESSKLSTSSGSVTPCGLSGIGNEEIDNGKVVKENRSSSGSQRGGCAVKSFPPDRPAHSNKALNKINLLNNQRPYGLTGHEKIQSFESFMAESFSKKFIEGNNVCLTNMALQPPTNLNLLTSDNLKKIQMSFSGTMPNSLPMGLTEAMPKAFLEANNYDNSLLVEGLQAATTITSPKRLERLPMMVSQASSSENFLLLPSLKTHSCFKDNILEQQGLHLEMNQNNSSNSLGGETFILSKSSDNSETIMKTNLEVKGLQEDSVKPSMGLESPSKQSEEMEKDQKQNDHDSVKDIAKSVQKSKPKAMDLEQYSNKLSDKPLEMKELKNEVENKDDPEALEKFNSLSSIWKSNEDNLHESKSINEKELEATDLPKLSDDLKWKSHSESTNLNSIESFEEAKALSQDDINAEQEKPYANEGDLPKDSKLYSKTLKSENKEHKVEASLSTRRSPSPGKSLNMENMKEKPTYIQETKNRLKCFNIFANYRNSSKETASGSKKIYPSPLPATTVPKIPIKNETKPKSSAKALPKPTPSKISRFFGSGTNSSSYAEKPQTSLKAPSKAASPLSSQKASAKTPLSARKLAEAPGKAKPLLKVNEEMALRAKTATKTQVRKKISEANPSNSLSEDSGSDSKKSTSSKISNQRMPSASLKVSPEEKDLHDPNLGKSKLLPSLVDKAKAKFLTSKNVSMAKNLPKNGLTTAETKTSKQLSAGTNSKIKSLEVSRAQPLSAATTRSLKQTKIPSNKTASPSSELNAAAKNAVGLRSEHK